MSYTLSILRAELIRRSERIRRAASLLKISIEPLENQSFVVRAWWDGGEYTQKIDANNCKNTRACQLALLLIQDILKKRNV